MVRTRPRPPAPALVTRKSAQWTARWRKMHAAGSRGDWATQAAKQALRDPLHKMTHGKCAYCEGQLDAQSFQQIDHYVSRKVDPDRVFEWRNLLPICQVCNVRKGHQDHRGALLKPDDEDPEAYFWVGPEGRIEPHPVLGEPEKLRAAETIRLCNLNRGTLQRSRRLIAVSVQRWLSRLTQESSPVLIEEWVDLSDPAAPYKLVLRHTLRAYPALVEHDRRRFTAA